MRKLLGAWSSQKPLNPSHNFAECILGCSGHQLQRESHFDIVEGPGFMEVIGE